MKAAEQKVKHINVVASAQGGVLVFLPGYSIMDKVLERWHQTGIFELMKQEVGSIIVESRGSSKTKVTTASRSMNDQKGSNNSTPFTFGSSSNTSGSTDPDEIEEENFASIVKEFDLSIKKYKSCLLFAVCR
jgi:Rad3-related DNA helicase